MRQTIELQLAHQHDRWKARQGNAISIASFGVPHATRSRGGDALDYRLLLERSSRLDQDESSDPECVVIDLHRETLEAIMSGRPTLRKRSVTDIPILERRCEQAFGRARIPTYQLPGREPRLTTAHMTATRRPGRY
jgi:hypothetical protein